MQSKSEIEQAQKAAGGRLNWGEYSKLTGTPIPKDTTPSATKTPQNGAAKNRIKIARKYAGRINAAELDALMKRQGKRTTKRMPK
jgi:hypothetical protein